MRKETALSRFRMTSHHIHPRSRTTRDNREDGKKTVQWPRYFHEAWHGIYINATMAEIRVINQIINVPGRAFTQEEFSKLLYIDCRVPNPGDILLRINNDDMVVYEEEEGLLSDREMTKHFIYRVVKGNRLNGTHSFMPISLETSWQTMFKDLSLQEVNILVAEMNEPDSIWPHEKILSKIKEIKGLSETAMN